MFLPLIQKLLLDYITKKTHSFGFSFNFQALGLTVLTGVFALLTFFFLLFAFQTYMVELYGKPASWLLTAALTFVLACITYLSASFSRRKKGLISKIQDKIKEESGDHWTPMVHIIRELVTPVQDHPIAAVILAALAGVAAGDKLHADKGTDS